MRIIALDLGTKRVGVAMSDELGLTAQGLTVLDRNPKADFLSKVKALVKEHGADRVVVGLPRRMDGSLGPEAQSALGFIEELHDYLGLEVLSWDERLSTVAVERILLEADLSRKKRKKVRDKVAAVYILQGYMDFLRSSPPGGG